MQAATATVTESPDAALVARLRAGDERAFTALVEDLHPVMVRLAGEFVSSRAVAEEVAQEAWLGVLAGLGRFEGRASLRTWILRIVVNRARTRGVREHRTVPFSSAWPGADGDRDAGPTVAAERFLGPGHRWAGHWASAPRAFPGPEERLLGRETLDVVRRALAGLPAAQRVVVTLRDVEGWEPHEVCALLEITEANQRVLLHRGRARVRAALERHLGDA